LARETVGRSVCIVLAFTLCLTLWAPLVAIAQPEEITAPKQLNVDRDQLTIVGIKGKILTRTLLLYTDSGPIQEVKVMPRDLDRTDEQAVFLKQRIQVEPPKPLAQIAAHDPVSIALTFDLGSNKNLGDLRSGHFKGELWFVYDGGPKRVPVSVTVKDRQYLPLLVLLLGVVLGLVVTRYRAIGKPRDEVIVRIDALRKQMEVDKNLAEAFRTRLNSEIIDVEAALMAAQWDEARTEMAEAEALWTRWRRGREDWIEQFRYIDEKLRPRLQDLDSQALIVRDLQRQLEDLERKAAGFESPDTLREQLQSVAGQINDVARLYAHLDQLEELLERLAGESDEEEWQGKFFAFRQDLRQLKPGDDPSQLKTDLTEAIKTLEKRTPQRSLAKGKGIPGMNEVLALLEPLPGTLQAGLITEPSKAETRLQWFTYGTYAIAILLLAWAGFEKLYVARPDFGITPSSDYFSLLLWGFGSEATRASIIELIQGRGASDSK